MCNSNGAARPFPELLSHPAADLLPLLLGDAYVQLREDIARNGLLEAIVIHERMILDGRNRYRACRELHIEPRFVEWAGEAGTPEEYVLAKNVKRRHLRRSQLAALAARAMPILERAAGERKAQAAARQPHVRAADGTFQEVSKVPPPGAPSPGEPPPPAQRRKARDEAAALFGVSGGYVQQAKRVMKARPDLFLRLERGELSLGEALRSMAGAPPAGEGAGGAGRATGTRGASRRPRQPGPAPAAPLPPAPDAPPDPAPPSAPELPVHEPVLVADSGQPVPPEDLPCREQQLSDAVVRVNWVLTHLFVPRDALGTDVRECVERIVPLIDQAYGLSCRLLSRARVRARHSRPDDLQEAGPS